MTHFLYHAYLKLTNPSYEAKDEYVWVYRRATKMLVKTKISTMPVVFRR